MTLRVDDSEKVNGLKRLIEKKLGIPVAHQRLYLDGIQLEDRRYLSDYDLGTRNAVLHLTPHVPDCPVQSIISVTVDDIRVRSHGVRISEITNIIVENRSSQTVVPGRTIYNELSKTATFIPNEVFDSSTDYVVKVTTKAIRDLGQVQAQLDFNRDPITLIVSRYIPVDTNHERKRNLAIINDISCSRSGDFERLREVCFSELGEDLSVKRSVLDSTKLYLLVPSGQQIPLYGDASVRELKSRDVILVAFPGEHTSARRADDELRVYGETASVPIVPRNQLVLVDVLHTSAFSIVHRGRWLESDIAVKVLRIPTSLIKDFCEVGRELAVLSKLHHPRILGLMATCLEMTSFEGGSLGLITPFMSKGSLFSLLHRSTEPDSHGSEGDMGMFAVPEVSSLSYRLRVAVDIASGMRFLHHSGIVHGNLTSRNVLLDENRRAVVGSILLGALAHCNGAGIPRYSGTPAWTAPELLDESGVQSPSTDAYSFGVVLWELVTGEVPWEELTETEISSIINGGGRNLEVPASYTCSISLTDDDTAEPIPDVVANVIRSCFGSPIGRPSFDRIHDLLYACLLE
eukprot:gene3936-4939_t